MVQDLVNVRYNHDIQAFKVVMEIYFFMPVYSFNISDNVSSKVKCFINKTFLNVFIQLAAKYL